jgi:hypothetical protein
MTPGASDDSVLIVRTLQLEPKKCREILTGAAEITDRL